MKNNDDVITIKLTRKEHADMMLLFHEARYKLDGHVADVMRTVWDNLYLNLIRQLIEFDDKQN